MWERSDRHVPIVITGVGMILLAITTTEAIVRVFGPAPILGLFLAGLATSVPFVLLLIFGGFYLRRADISTRFYPRVLSWSAAAGVAFGGLIGMFTPLIFDTWLDYMGTIRWAVSIGIGGGLLIGYFNVRMIERTVAAERASVRAEEAEQRREFLEYLNALLRHEVLNAANVIDGRAKMVDQRADTDDIRNQTAIISRQATDLTSIIKDVRFLVNATEATDTTEPVDVTRMIRTELDKLTDRHEAVSVEATLPDRVEVAADDLLPRLFRNLFENAVEHADTAPSITIQCTTTNRTATVQITDNGPGVPEDLRENLFDPAIARRDDESRLGTVIVGRLAERYEGRVELINSGPEGTTVVVELPLADSHREQSGTNSVTA